MGFLFHKLQSTFQNRMCQANPNTMLGFLLLMVNSTSQSTFRPPAVPLVTMDPYISVWSMTDKLTDDWPRHWTGGIMGMFGMVRIDGKAYRWCGPAAIDVPAMEQISLNVSPLISRYQFTAGGVDLIVEFCSAAQDQVLNVPVEPLSFITLRTRSVDQKAHEVSLYFDVTGEWSTKSSDEKINISRYKVMGRNVMTISSAEQPVLQHRGDRIRIDWGRLYLFPPSQQTETIIGAHDTVRQSFADTGKLPLTDELDFPKSVNENWPVAAMAIPTVRLYQKHPENEERIFIVYDQQSSIEYFKRPLDAFWRRNGGDLKQVFSQTADALDTMNGGATAYSAREPHFDATPPSYNQILALAYRQCLAGHGLVEDLNGDLLMFAKENTSNGCIATVDVIFPACPFFLYFSPELMKANLRPVLDYASMPRWKFPFAPHDLGTYPKANGQVYGGGEKTEEDQMPVEETANMLLMMDAVARVEKNTKFASKYVEILKKWANYLLEKGFDPENQLCTDDFTGHLAHNANLSIKAIIAIRAYADLLEMMGKKEEAKPFIEKAQQWAKDWVKAADDGDHFRLAFDKPGTWSQKYNLVWDKLLGFGLFPQEVIDKELKFYAKHFNKYGLPLDSRATFTKDDWQIWTGSLTSSPADFAPYADTIYKMLNETTSRVPFTDWHDTISGETRGMYARTVIGGVFMKLLMDSGKLKR